MCAYLVPAIFTGLCIETQSVHLLHVGQVLHRHALLPVPEPGTVLVLAI
jgi:hypothetical protein